MIKRFIATLLLATVTCSTLPAKAEVNPYGEPYLIRCTCYTAPDGAITASGAEVREGIVAGKREWLGYACVIYENDNGQVGDVIGVYEFKDTGGPLIQSGERIDVYRDTLERCYAWIGDYGDYVYIQIIPAEG